MTINDVFVFDDVFEGLACYRCQHRQTCTNKEDEFVLEALPNHRCPGFETKERIHNEEHR